jgi:AAA15 family ATPase/GTPase
MQIKTLYVDNFRGMDNFTISDFDQNVLIIGKNDAGKTNVCVALRKLLDISFRRIPFDEADSTNSNKKDITISAVLSVDGISSENRSLLGAAVDKDNTMMVKYVGKFDEDIHLYNESLFLNENDPIEYPTNRTTPIDKVIDVIYINPVFNLYEDKDIFFKFRNSEDKENGHNISSNVASEIERLNDTISSEENIKNINDRINEKASSCTFFEGMKFKTESNINPTNIYRSLDIVPYDNNNSRYNNIGDGKNKTLSFLLRNMSNKEEKEKILIVEEPENHLYPQYQRQFSQLIDSINPSQTIVTTHSPSIIDFRKTKRILKLFRANGQVAYKAINASSFPDFTKSGFSWRMRISPKCYFMMKCCLSKDFPSGIFITY